MRDYTYIIIRSNRPHGKKEEQEVRRGNTDKDVPVPYEHSARNLMSEKGYVEYVNHHGYHFTVELSNHASAMLENANGQPHLWSESHIRQFMEKLKITLPETATIGDMVYISNLLYSDLYPSPFNDETLCIIGAYKTIHDVDGYEGKVFMHWISDVIGKRLNIDWEKFI